MKPVKNNNFYKEIKRILEEARQSAYRAVNVAMVIAYWEIGRRIVEEEQQGNKRAGYGLSLLKDLSKQLSEDFGKGYSVQSLENFRKFYLAFPPIEISSAVQRKSIKDKKSSALRRKLPAAPPSGKTLAFQPQLSWTHYKLLMRIENKTARKFYLQEAVDQNFHKFYEYMNERKLESIIVAYKVYRKQNPDKWLDDCKHAKSLEQAIELAATARNNENKKHDHQNLIPTSTLDSFAVNILNRINEIRQVRSFSELIASIQNSKIKGIGDLTIYDTAQRIGNYLGIQPDKIYLHRGVRTGAEILLGKIKTKYITKDQLPTPFNKSDLSAADFEDILCVYKNRIATCI
jgi:hypothetical protein